MSTSLSETKSCENWDEDAEVPLRTPETHEPDSEVDAAATANTSKGLLRQWSFSSLIIQRE